MGPTHLTQAGRRGPWRERSATLTEHHVELDEVCTICLQDAHEGERMCRLICRHMFHYSCWTQAVAAGPARNQERVATCPNCRGRGHVISCWHYMDTSITTQYNPATGREAPNLMNPTRTEPVPAFPAVSAAPQTPRQSRVPKAMARRLAPQLHTPERTTA